MLMAQTNTTPESFSAFTHSVDASTDHFADYAVNKENYLRRMTYGLAQIGTTTAPAVVPKGAEALLETRLSYLGDVQRPAALKTIAVTSGFWFWTTQEAGAASISLSQQMDMRPSMTMLWY